MRILFLIRSLNAGGAERQLVTLANGLARMGHDIHVALFYRGGVFEDALDARVRIHSLDKRGRWDSLDFLFRWARLLRSIRPDIVHGYLSSSNLLALFARLVAPQALIVWGVRASNMDLSRYDWLARLESWTEAKLSRGGDLVICNSRSGAEYVIQRGFPAHSVKVVANGIDTEKFKPDQEERRRIRAELNVPDDRILIGLAARLDPMKDHATFLKVAHLLTQQRDDLQFVCIGSGSAAYANSLKNMASKYGLESCLIWAGEREEMPAMYNALDVAISSSYPIEKAFPIRMARRWPAASRLL